MPNFETMTQDEAISYCYKHKKEWLREVDASEREFDCTISCLESGHIKPVELPSYGFDYE